VFPERSALIRLVVMIMCTISVVAQQSSSVSADEIWSDLVAGNQRFVLGKIAPHDFPAQRKSLERVSKIDSASRQVLTCKAGCRLSFCHEEAAEAIDG
jgi:hypothetical protein